MTLIKLNYRRPIYQGLLSAIITVIIWNLNLMLSESYFIPRGIFADPITSLAILFLFSTIMVSSPDLLTGERNPKYYSYVFGTSFIVTIVLFLISILWTLRNFSLF